MLITVFFTDKGLPKTGLSAEITIVDLASSSIVIDALPMSDKSGGWYIYDFIIYDADKNYGITADGSNALSDIDRYKSNTNETEYNTEFASVENHLVIRSAMLTDPNPTALEFYTDLTEFCDNLINANRSWFPHDSEIL